MSDEKDLEKLLADGNVDDNVVMEHYEDVVEFGNNLISYDNYCYCSRYHRGTNTCVQYTCKW